MEFTCNTTWNVPDEAVTQVAVDLITTAVEGGINDWASVSEYHWGQPGLGHSNRREWSEEDTSYANVTVHDLIDEDAPPEGVAIDVPKMVETIRKVVAGDFDPFYNAMSYSQTYRQRLTALFDQLERGVPLDEADYDYDALDADHMVQLIMFGKIEYS
jgi:hypothetical protein